MSFFWLRTWQIGTKSLLLHPLRSGLTVLGILIGVAVVIWLLAVGEGISLKAQENIEGLGANNIIVRSFKPPAEANEGASGVVPYGVTRDDFERLTETIPTIERALPIRELRRRFTFAGRQVDGRLVGCTAEYAEVTRLEVDRGHFVTDADARDMKNHCALSAEVAKRLFPIEDPIGRAIRVEETYYVVVGVMKPRGPSAAIGGSLAAQSFRDDVYIPITTLWNRIGDFIITRRPGSFEGEQVELSQITLRVDKIENVLETAKLVKRTIDMFHPKDKPGITVPKELLEHAENIRLMFMIVMGLIAAVTLLVGGIGIMNIMLATVTERTREIGIRRALGAKRGDIIRQFLVETVALATLGGVLGVVLGLGSVGMTNLALDEIREDPPKWMAQVPDEIKSAEAVIVPWSIPVAFAIAVLIGIIFGIYPAMRAAEMDPIEALRHE